ncbi:hypothetical protein BCR39DRAFT_598805 [Naematelia encephala]|uniref:Uncharacterized protein n=1 Tax=Naematelia encephala TaxID=71784 RepID=A0A1Y2B2R0_9TREE|nr:hypothetical protein BCR39DRAFT_598805 [Naematelia encephala]
MSDAEAERKAKAARAKKLLAQRQKAKAASTTSSIAPSSPASTIGDVATVPSARTSLSLDESAREEVERVVTPTQEKDEKEKVVKEKEKNDSAVKLQETISLLIQERADLQSRIAGLEGELNKAKAQSQLLEEGRALIGKLEEEKRELEEKLTKAEMDGTRVKKLEENIEKVHEERDNMLFERDLLIKERDDAEAGRIACEEGVAGRVGDVEKQLERARERESGLEAEIARLRQSNTELNGKVDSITSELDSERAKAGESSTSFSTLRNDHEALQSTHLSLQSEHDKLRSTHEQVSSTYAALKAEHDATSSSSTDLSSTLSSTRTELEKTRNNLEKATKRAEEAERKRVALQGENDELVKQLEEIRERIMQVVEEKAELANILDTERRATSQLELLESEQAGRIRQLESALHTATSRVHALSKQVTDNEPKGIFLSPKADSPIHDIEPRRPRSIDSALPAAVRHKRQVSLTALKARMEPRSPLRSTMESVAEESDGRKQFGDEIVFCCPACEGDLITL